VVKNLSDKQRRRGDAGLIPGSGNGNLLQYFCRENPTDRKAWQVTVHGVAKRIMQSLKRMSTRNAVAWENA